MVRSISLAVLGLSMLTTDIFGQQDPQFSQYMFNTIYYNPGFSGTENVTKITALHRNQWLGYAPTYGGGGAPTTQLLTFSTPMHKLNSGFGGYVSHDNLGPVNTLEVQASYAYHLKIKNSKLSLGVRPGVLSQTINSNYFRAVDPESFLNEGSQSQIKPDLAVGAFLKNEKFYIGASLNHLTHPMFSVGNTKNKFQSHGYVTAGYNYEMNFDLKFLFTSLVQTDFTQTTVNLSALAYLKNLWGGLAYRQGDAAILMLGYSFLKDRSMKFGYTLDYIVNARSAKQPTSHEFMIIYELPTNYSTGKKIVRTPRYRH